MRALTATLAAATLLVAADTPPVERHVTGQTLTSGSLPRATLTFDPAFQYVGSQRFPLYGVADAEQHFFVDAGPDHQIRRFYWLQFEHYLPDNTSVYKYPETRATDIGGLSFVTDSGLYVDYNAGKPRPDSDSAKARELLSAKGYKFPTSLLRVRMVHLPGTDKRSELMIIYGEALSPAEMPKDATANQSADDRYPELAARVLQHAKQGLKIVK